MGFKSERISAESVENCKDSTATAAPQWLVQAPGRDVPEASPWGGLSGHVQLEGTFQAKPVHLPTKERINTMADTQIQLWLYIKTSNNIKKSSCPAVVHVKVLHDKMDADSELHADTQWIDGWMD